MGPSKLTKGKRYKMTVDVICKEAYNYGAKLCMPDFQNLHVQLTGASGLERDYVYSYDGGAFEFEEVLPEEPVRDRQLLKVKYSTGSVRWFWFEGIHNWTNGPSRLTWEDFLVYVERNAATYEVYDVDKA